MRTLHDNRLPQHVAGITAWPIDVSLVSLFWLLLGFFVHFLYVTGWAMTAAFMLADYSWHPWGNPAMPTLMLVLPLLTVIGVNLCVTTWAVGMWRSSRRMVRFSIRRKRARAARQSDTVASTEAVDQSGETQ